MLFTSPIFLFVFLPLVLLINRLLSGRVFISNIFLLLASSFFYYYGEQEKILLMYFVIALNWLTAKQVYSGTLADNTFKEKTLFQKLALYACIFVCIGRLWYYKYLNFSISIFSLTFLPE